MKFRPNSVEQERVAGRTPEVGPRRRPWTRLAGGAVDLLQRGDQVAACDEYRRSDRLQYAVLLTTLLAFAAAASAESARGLVARGNTSYTAGRYDEAMKAYEQADVESPQSPVVAFNQGAVHYRAEDYPAARESFEEAARRSRDPAFEAKCRYNVGNCWFREARRQMDSDLKKAVEACERSVDSYEAAVALQPEFAEAKRNIEVVRRLWKSILDEQKKRQEEQKAQQEQQQKLADQLKQLIERQEQAAKQSTDLAQKQQSQGASPAVRDQSTAQAKDQRQLGQDTQAAADTLKQALSQAQPPPAAGTPPAQPPAQPPPDHPALQHMDSARQAQDQAAQKLDEVKPQPAAGDQKKAAEALRQALESLKKPQQEQQQGQQNQGQQDKDQQDKDQQNQEQQGKDQQQGQQNQEQQQEPQSQEQQATSGAEKQEPEDQKQARARLADQDARDILDEEKRNQDRRTATEQNAIQPVDKDW